MDHTKINPADLDSPCREFSNGGLGIVVALLVFWQIDVLSLVLGVQSSCMLVLGGGWAWVKCCLRVGGKNGLFLIISPLVRKGSMLHARSGALFRAWLCRKGFGGSTFARGLLSEPSLRRNGPQRVPLCLRAPFKN